MTRCTHCSEKLEVEEAWTGQNAVCPRCNKEFTIQPKLGLPGKTSKGGSSPITQNAPPPPENAGKGLRPPKRRRRFFSRKTGCFFTFLLLLGGIGGGGYYLFLGIKEHLFLESGFYLAESSDNNQIQISGHGLYLKAEKNTVSAPEKPQPSQPATWEESLENSTPDQKYAEWVRNKAQKENVISRIFTRQYTGTIYLPEQNMIWGKMEVKDGKAHGTLRLYRFRSGRETMTHEWTYKNGRLTKFIEHPRKGKERIVYIYYDFLDRFTHAVSEGKVIAKAQYDKFSQLKNIVIQTQPYRIIQYYQAGRLIREERFKNKDFIHEVQYEYDADGFMDINNCKVYDGNGRPLTALPRTRIAPSIEICKIFMQRQKYRRPFSFANDMPDPETPTTQHNAPTDPNQNNKFKSTYEQRPSSVAERMARPATHPSSDPNTAGSHAAPVPEKKK